MVSSYRFVSILTRWAITRVSASMKGAARAGASANIFRAASDTLIKDGGWLVDVRRPQPSPGSPVAETLSHPQGGQRRFLSTNHHPRAHLAFQHHEQCVTVITFVHDGPKGRHLNHLEVGQQ
jgi:hypothetical protein